jgi:hypothetical protein
MSLEDFTDDNGKEEYAVLSRRASHSDREVCRRYATPVSRRAEGVLVDSSVLPHCLERALVLVLAPKTLVVHLFVVVEWVTSGERDIVERVV